MCNLATVQPCAEALLEGGCGRSCSTGICDGMDATATVGLAASSTGRKEARGVCGSEAIVTPSPGSSTAEGAGNVADIPEVAGAAGVCHVDVLLAGGLEA